MAKEYKIEIVRAECISCGSCAATCGKLFEMDSDGKSALKGSKKKNELEIDKKDLTCAKEAVEICPVKCIHIYDLKTKKKLM